MIAYLAGGVGGAGLCFLAWWLFYPGPSLSARVLPYTEDGWTPRHRALPLTRALLRVFDQIGSTAASVHRRTYCLGTLSYRDFRVRQIEASSAGFVAGCLLGASALRRGVPPLIALIFPVFAALVGAALTDYWLSRTLSRRDAVITGELPDVAQILSLAVGAGESALSAFEYVCRLGNGPLAAELRRTVAAVHAGDSFEQALAGLQERVHNPAIERFCDALRISLEQGSPLANTLRVQAEDAREYQRRELLEKGGKQEIAMMAPVVFLILPITIIFALYPGISSLNMW
ncbi:Flp pilus assembly protein TadB [Actinobaculum suis]|uniref:Flp pilus assembly protein TadB n=1 Tax=Actinobaculum suis TaxID=1657 RepID=A0A7Z8Y8W4_9ACTO|nr:type II secretion system F family protein [Actinobaculum suis]VDG76133.1 Flp pilus assembly protein TadB [Actinobaculum suis]